LELHCTKSELVKLICCLAGSRRRLVDELSSGDEADHDENQEHAATMAVVDAEEVHDGTCQSCVNYMPGAVVALDRL